MRKMLSKNGTRQPQAANCSGESVAASARKSPFASTTPTGTPIWAKLP
jgi:hypothetical protein